MELNYAPPMIEILERLGCYPRYCVWELTLACNLRCRHCGSFAGEPRADELSLDECLRVAGELADLGCEKVTLSGGEPTLCAHWHEVGRALTERGVRVNIISNGWRWTAAHLEQARASGLANVAFSLDGLEEAHDAVRRAGSFERVVAAIDRSVAAGVLTSVITHINRKNGDSLLDLRRMLADRGVSSWQLQTGNPTGEMSHHPEMVVAPEDLLWIVPLVADMRRDQSAGPYVLAADNIGYFGRHEDVLRSETDGIPFWIGCRAGCQVIGIESNGNVKGCLSLPSTRHDEDRFVEGNLRESSLAEIWSRPGAFAYNRRFDVEQLGGFCGVCRYRDICRGGCSWTAFSRTGDRHDNPFCFYRQAVCAGRMDLLADGDQPSEEELAWARRG